MVKEHPIQKRNMAIGMLKGGMTQSCVSKEIGANIRTIRRWWENHMKGIALDNTPGRGRKKSLPKVAKIIISKSLNKKQQSTRKLTKRLKRNGITVSYMTVQRYLKTTIGAKSYKRPLMPRLSPKQKENRLTFCKERLKWTVEDWRRVLFSDESPFEVFHTPNRQNDRIWTRDRSSITPHQTVKFPSKLHVWGLISYTALSDLHIIPQGRTVTAEYYIEEILNRSLMFSIKRKRKTGSVLTRKLLPNMSGYIFQQDGAPAHHATRTQDWCKEHLKAFWEKGIWPGNSPDLNPIDNLWAIVQSSVDGMEEATNQKVLEKQLKLAWSQITPDILDNLVSSMPERVKACVKHNGGYIGK